MDYYIDNIVGLTIEMKRLGCECIIDFAIKSHVTDRIMGYVVTSALLFDQGKWVNGLPIHNQFCTSSSPATLTDIDIFRIPELSIMQDPVLGNLADPVVI